MLKYQKFVIIFAKIWTEKRKYRKFFGFKHFSIFKIFTYKSDTNFPSLPLKSSYFFRFYSFFGFYSSKNYVDLALSWEFGE